MRNTTHCLAALALFSSLIAPALAREVPPLTPKELTFSVENMDISVDPRKDFYAYASGLWQKTAVRPERMPRIGPFDYMGEQLNARMLSALTKAGADAPTAEKGSTTQLVGDFYAAYMDTARMDSVGMAAAQPELDRIKAIANTQDLSRFIGRYFILTGDVFLLGIVPSTDHKDNRKQALFAVSGSAGLDFPAVFEGADGSSQREGYRTFLRKSLIVAGYDEARAARVADLVLNIETELHKGRLTPTEAANPLNRYNPMPFADLQKQIPELDLPALLDELGIAAPQTVVQTETTFPPVLSQVLKKYTLDEIMDYAAWAFIRKFSSVLSTKFEAPLAELNKALTGTDTMPTRTEAAMTLMIKDMGHPVSKLYVEAYFAETMRARAADMIARIKAVFVERMKNNTWLTPPTKAEALRKVEKLSYAVGYPDIWIDFSKVDIRRDDAFGNLLRVRDFTGRRELAKFGKPVVRDAFANSGATLPIIINAAYDQQLNGFEVPAAFMQPPAFEPNLDAPVTFCKFGAVIGHEMTHGFDSTGRNFDADGNQRDWWTPQDTENFLKEANKLVEQANAYEILPGVKLNGKLNVTENMADAGGITLAYEALKQYLAEHPEENKPVDGLTPEQRCFISYAQLWTSIASEPFIRHRLDTDIHAPNQYRATAALQHVDGFYDAFGIKEGDPMWLSPEKRLKAW